MLRLANMTSSMRPPAMVVAMVATVVCVAAPARAQPQQLATTALAGEVELARLVDLCAQRLGLKIEYDAKTVQGAKVTLRLGESVTDDQLWALTNQLLATRGLTSAQPDATRRGARRSEASQPFRASANVQRASGASSCSRWHTT